MTGTEKELILLGLFFVVAVNEDSAVVSAAVLSYKHVFPEAEKDALASVVPRVLSGPAEHPPPVPAPPSAPVGSLRPELAMGLQSATAALFIVILNATIGLTESAWAITACT
jgi:hypothetical protein